MRRRLLENSPTQLVGASSQLSVCLAREQIQARSGCWSPGQSDTASCRALAAWANEMLRCGHAGNTAEKRGGSRPASLGSCGWRARPVRLPRRLPALLPRRLLDRGLLPRGLGRRRSGRCLLGRRGLRRRGRADRRGGKHRALGLLRRRRLLPRSRRPLGAAQAASLVAQLGCQHGGGLGRASRGATRVRGLRETRAAAARSGPGRRGCGRGGDLLARARWLHRRVAGGPFPPARARRSHAACGRWRRGGGGGALLAVDPGHLRLGGRVGWRRFPALGRWRQ